MSKQFCQQQTTTNNIEMSASFNPDMNYDAVSAFIDPAEAKRNETTKKRTAILAQIEQDRIERRLKYSALTSSSSAAPVDSVLASVSNSAPASALASSSAAAHSHSVIGGYTTENLPENLRQYKKNEFKKFRDAVCEVLKLRFKSIGGNGNCFFESVSALLQHAREFVITPDQLRQHIVSFLRECLDNHHNILGERCMVDMEGELGQPITGEGSSGLRVG